MICQYGILWSLCYGFGQFVCKSYYLKLIIGWGIGFPVLFISCRLLIVGGLGLWLLYLNMLLLLNMFFAFFSTMIIKKYFGFVMESFFFNYDCVGFSSSYFIFKLFCFIGNKQNYQCCTLDVYKRQNIYHYNMSIFS